MWENDSTASESDWDEFASRVCALDGFENHLFVLDAMSLMLLISLRVEFCDSMTSYPSCHFTSLHIFP